MHKVNYGEGIAVRESADHNVITVVAECVRSRYVQMRSIVATHVRVDPKVGVID